MPVLYADLPLLWLDIANAVSGMATDVTAVPHDSIFWAGAGGTTASVVLGTLTVNLGTPEGLVQLQCPAPEDSLVGAKDLEARSDWWRNSTTSGTGDVKVITFDAYHLEWVRKPILEACFGNLSHHLTERNYAVYIQTSTWWMQQIETNEHVMWTNTIAETDPFSWAGGGCASVSTAVVWGQRGVGPDPPGDLYLWWVPPSEDGGLKTIFAGGSDSVVPADPVDIAALNIYSDRMAGAAARGAITIQTHRDRTLVRVTNSSGVVLPDPTGTYENAIRRLAAATRAYFQGGPIVENERGNQVAMAENVLVRRKQ